jgi:hypothetical protein
MAKKKIDPKNNSANQKNDNKGTTGTNEQFDAAQRNRENQKREQLKKNNGK